MQVVLECPGQLLAWLQLSRYCFSAVAHNGLQAMLPLVANLLPAAWQLCTDCLSICSKLLCQCRSCDGGRSTAADPPGSAGLARSSQVGQHPTTSKHQQPQLQQQQHVGPAVADVLRELLQGLAPAWECYQALIRQRFEQRQLYLSSPEAELDGLMCSPANLMCSPAPVERGGAADAGSQRAMDAELQGHMKWMVALLNLGRLLHGGAELSAGFGLGQMPGGGSSECARGAALDQRLQVLWAEALQAVVGATTAPLARVSSITLVVACRQRSIADSDQLLTVTNCRQ